MAVELMLCNIVLTPDNVIPAFSTHIFYWEVLDFNNIKISQVILRNTSFQLFLRIFEILFFKSSLMKLFFRLPVSINDAKYTWNINRDEVTHNFECNHEKVDTRMVLHAVLPSVDVVVATGTDVLILMIYTYSKFMVKRRWVFRYENDKCAVIETIFLYLGKCFPGIIDMFFHYDIQGGLYLKHFLEKWTPPQKLSMCTAISLLRFKVC